MEKKSAQYMNRLAELEQTTRERYECALEHAGEDEQTDAYIAQLKSELDTIVAKRIELTGK